MNWAYLNFLFRFDWALFLRFWNWKLFTVFTIVSLKTNFAFHVFSSIRIFHVFKIISFSFSENFLVKSKMFMMFENCSIMFFCFFIHSCVIFFTFFTEHWFSCKIKSFKNALTTTIKKFEFFICFCCRRKKKDWRNLTSFDVIWKLKKMLILKIKKKKKILKKKKKN